MNNPVTHRPPWTVRIATFSAAHRWPVIVLWFVATIGLFAASLAAGGTDAANAVDDESGTVYESRRANELFSASGAQEPLGQVLYLVASGDPATVDDADLAAAFQQF